MLEAEGEGEGEGGREVSMSVLTSSFFRSVRIEEIPEFEDEDERLASRLGSIPARWILELVSINEGNWNGILRITKLQKCRCLGKTFLGKQISPCSRCESQPSGIVNEPTATYS